jgi:hypothetical protein
MHDLHDLALFGQVVLQFPKGTFMDADKFAL